MLKISNQIGFKVLGNSIIDIETSKNPLNIAFQTELLEE